MYDNVDLFLHRSLVGQDVVFVLDKRRKEFLDSGDLGKNVTKKTFLAMDIHAYMTIHSNANTGTHNNTYMIIHSN